MWNLIAGPIINAVSGFVGKRQERKQTIAKANAAWEAAAGRSMENGWKDEYVTVVITFPIVQNFVGNLMYAFTGNSKILEAQKASLEQIGQMMGTPYGDLMMVVVLAAVGIKGIKALR